MNASSSGSRSGSEAPTVGAPTSLLTGIHDFYRLRFLDESSRLFKTDTDELETLIIPNVNSSMLLGTR